MGHVRVAKKCKACRYAGFCAPWLPKAGPPFLWAWGHPTGSVLPTRRLSGATSMPTYLVLLRAEIARFTRTQTARLCSSNPHLMPGGRPSSFALSFGLKRGLRSLSQGFQWRGVTSCAALCSPDVPPVRLFRPCTSGGLAGFTLLFSHSLRKPRSLNKQNVHNEAFSLEQYRLCLSGCIEGD
jgi:hypothetical protein